jgi:hypothetical protein
MSKAGRPAAGLHASLGGHLRPDASRRLPRPLAGALPRQGLQHPDEFVPWAGSAATHTDELFHLRDDHRRRSVHWQRP